jgi:hypothetical protein
MLELFDRRSPSIACETVQRLRLGGRSGFRRIWSSVLQEI